MHRCLLCDLQEVELLRRLSFDGNIVQFYGACLQRGSIMMVLELMGVSVMFPKAVSAHSGSKCLVLQNLIVLALQYIAFAVYGTLLVKARSS